MRGARRRPNGGRTRAIGWSHARLPAAWSPDVATDLVHRVARDGTVAWSRRGLAHVRAEEMTTVECDHILRVGVADPPELRHGQWRYRIHCQRMCVVVVFRSGVEAVVVDAWRKQG
jgi:hypothetical protein